jgi:FHA domain
MTQCFCTNCKMPYPPDELYCPFCGGIFVRVIRYDPKALTDRLEGVPVAVEGLQWGSAYFSARAKLLLQFNGGRVIPVTLGPHAVFLGRNTRDDKVDIDLTPFNAGELGVSRRHSRLQREQGTLQITDLNSLNGTFVNQQRLAPGVPQLLRDRSVLQVGMLIMRVQFA